VKIVEFFRFKFNIGPSFNSLTLFILSTIFFLRCAAEKLGLLPYFVASDSSFLYALNKRE
jgi:hypothetical protein